MPDQRHPDKIVLSVYLPRLVMQRLRRMAINRGETVTAVMEKMLIKLTRTVELTEEDLAQIERETRAAKRRRKRKPAL